MCMVNGLTFIALAVSILFLHPKVRIIFDQKSKKDSVKISPELDVLHKSRTSTSDIPKSTPKMPSNTRDNSVHPDPELQALRAWDKGP